MKTKYFPLGLMAVFAMLLTQTQFAAAQNKKDSARYAGIKEMVTAQLYNFMAQSVTPLGGRLRQLNNNDQLRVTKDQIISDLPYFGRAYSAPIGSPGGIQFTSKDFDYRITEKKKGGWNVSIKFKDAQDVRQMQLSIFSNGTASLQVMSNNRQSISFNGYILSPEKK